MPSGEEPAAPRASPTHSAPGLPATIISLRQSRVWVPACSQWLDEHRSTESQQDCRQLFQKLSTHLSRSTPTCPKSSSPCRPAKSRPRRIASPTHSAPGLPATIISLRQSRVWVPACSQWLDEHRSTESQQDCRQLFQSCRHLNRSTPTCPKSSSPCRPAKSRRRAALRAQRIRHRDCRRRSSRCGNPCLGSCLLAT